jgi:hypothetical protein
MDVIGTEQEYTYIAATGDWRIRVSASGDYEILPQVGGYLYSSGTNLDNLADLIVAAKAHAIANGINWSNN